VTGTWQAWCNLGGSLLGGLGGLLLAYDLLGGRRGPLAIVTRTVTYSLMFGVAYTVLLGIRFALIVSVGIGASLGIEYFIAARQLRRVPGRRNYWMVILVGGLRALAVGAALGDAVSWGVAVVYVPAYTLFVVLYNFLGFAPADHRQALRYPSVRLRALMACSMYGVGAAACYALSQAVMPPPHPPSITVAYFGFTIGGCAFFSTVFDPVVEYWAEHMPKRTMAILGAALAILGFMLQALPNWIVLLS